MENINEVENHNRNIEGEKIVVKANDILKKLKTSEDRRNFASEIVSKFIDIIFVNILKNRLVYPKV